VYFTTANEKIQPREVSGNMPAVPVRSALLAPQEATVVLSREIEKASEPQNPQFEPTRERIKIPISEELNYNDITHFDRVSLIGLFEEFVSRKTPLQRPVSVSFR